jgi:(4-(4-[2-(gamma-L-glutamylamino)ethyl]phenoxymethyl)furan-2-yl)methanamine synthase
MTSLIGWDIGGAHLKAALLVQGRVQAVVQRPCALWLGLDRLTAAMDAVLQTLGPAAAGADHVVTITGELADGFADRQDGVAALAAHVAERFGEAHVRLFGVDFQAAQMRWHRAADARAHWAQIASANWWATAQYAAQAVPQGVLVDIGSTTSDFIAILRHQVRAAGHDDHSRLATGELLYHGVVRTPLCALGPRIEFRGRHHNLMNELFATSADVYRLTGELDLLHDQHPAADQGAKDLAGTQQRLARMVGLDARDAAPGDWQALARRWRERQIDEIAGNLKRVPEAAGLDATAPLVAAGCGAFLVPELAARLGRPWVLFDSLLPLADASCGPWARVCAPSVAVACLWAQVAQAGTGAG